MVRAKISIIEHVINIENSYFILCFEMFFFTEVVPFSWFSMVTHKCKLLAASFTATSVYVTHDTTCDTAVPTHWGCESPPATSFLYATWWIFRTKNVNKCRQTNLNSLQYQDQVVIYEKSNKRNKHFHSCEMLTQASLYLDHKPNSPQLWKDWTRD